MLLACFFRRLGVSTKRVADTGFQRHFHTGAFASLCSRMIHRLLFASIPQIPFCLLSCIGLLPERALASVQKVLTEILQSEL